MTNDEISNDETNAKRTKSGRKPRPISLFLICHSSFEFRHCFVIRDFVIRIFVLDYGYTLFHVFYPSRNRILLLKFSSGG
jgi:hypothetical protein